MSTYCKLVGDKKMAKGKYITINEALDDDDWALIFDKFKLFKKCNCKCKI